MLGAVQKALGFAVHVSKDFALEFAAACNKMSFFSVTLGCGSITTENCTYFESATTVNTGACRAKICKADSNICQIRLDFQKFVITGPMTTSTSVTAILNGQPSYATGKKVALTTQCLTDTFTVSGQMGLVPGLLRKSKT